MPRETRTDGGLEKTPPNTSPKTTALQVAVREVKGVARTLNFALSELDNKDIGSKHPVGMWFTLLNKSYVAMLDLTDAHHTNDN